MGEWRCLVCDQPENSCPSHDKDALYKHIRKLRSRVEELEENSVHLKHDVLMQQDVVKQKSRLLEQAEARVKELEGLLYIAQCPNCDGSGAIGHEAGGIYYDSDGCPNDGRYIEWEQCQWCFEVKALKGGSDG